MKALLLSLITISAITICSFGQTQIKKEINVTKSEILWKGYKVTGSHEGVIKIKSGFFSFQNERLDGGYFIIDMNSLTCTDLDGVYKNKLDDHLKSDHFFSVVKFPYSTLKITKVKSNGNKSYQCIGDITIKEKTESITFNIKLTDKNAITQLKIDRSKFDVRYKSKSFFDGLGDNLIYDEFDLIINLSF